MFSSLYLCWECSGQALVLVPGTKDYDVQQLQPSPGSLDTIDTVFLCRIIT